VRHWLTAGEGGQLEARERAEAGDVLAGWRPCFDPGAFFLPATTGASLSRCWDLFQFRPAVCDGQPTRDKEAWTMSARRHTVELPAFGSADTLSPMPSTARIVEIGGMTNASTGLPKVGLAEWG